MTSDDIRREIDASRRALQQDYAALRAELDFATKAKRAVVANPLPWLGGAAFLGYILSGRKQAKPPKRRRGEPEAVAPARKLTFLGVLFALARLLFPMARPALTAFAVRKLSGFATRFQP
jgi:hypothetical protein